MVWILIFCAVIILLSGWVFYLHYVLRKIKRANCALLKQAGGSNLEEILHSQNEHLKKQSQEIKNLQNFANSLKNDLGFTLSRANVLRFNAFPGEGGDQSFSLALLDQHKNGVVISSLHNREGDRVYAKPIQNSQSQYHLTKEEMETINFAFTRSAPTKSSAQESKKFKNNINQKFL